MPPTEKFPPCPPTGGLWQPNGSNHSSHGTHLYYRASDNLSTLLTVVERTGTMTAIVCDSRDVEVLNDYVNGTLATQARHHDRACDHVRETIEKHLWDEFCRTLGFPNGVKEKYSPEALGLTYTDNDGAPVELGDKAQAYDEGRHDFYNKNRATLNKWRFIPPPVPVNVPAELTVYWQPQGYEAPYDAPWVLVPHSYEPWIPLPEDPLRAEHDAFYREVFAAVKVRLGYDLSVILNEIPNEYLSKDSMNRVFKPWYKGRVQGTYSGLDIKVGPRSKVQSLTFNYGKGYDGKPRTPHALKALAERDKVTYYEDKDGVTIHAWGKDKLIEYLVAGIDAASLTQILRS